MGSFSLSKNYKYVIYGAAFRGKEIYNILNENGYSIDAFLDKRAQVLKEVNGIKVLEPESYSCDFDKTIIVVAITNHFVHSSVADYLFTLGYRKILYIPTTIGMIDSGYVTNIKNCYEKLLDGSISENDEVFEYNPEKSDVRFLDMSFIKKAEPDAIIAYVPLDLLFVSTIEVAVPEKNKQLCAKSDRPFYYGMADLIKYFRAIDGNEADSISAIQKYNECFLGNEESYVTFPKTSQGASDLLSNRQAVYNGMMHNLNYGMDFFMNTPILVKWNKKGYFNIEDGHHRAAFFCAKGIPRIPAKMAKKDYENWLNKEEANRCVAYAGSVNPDPSYTLLEHPNFFNYPSYRDVGGFSRIQKIMFYLAEKKVEIKGKSVLDAGSYYSFFSRYFYRGGAKVVSVEYCEKSFNIASMLNKLLHCTGIELINEGVQNLSRGGGGLF